jgi:hypothetical protein
VAVVDHREIGQRFARAMNALDKAALASCVTDDFVSEWPQSQERIRGLDNFFSMIANYPGASEGRIGNDPDSVLAHPLDAVKLVAPSYTLVTVEGGGGAGTFTLRISYPDGSVWWAVNLYRLREGRIAHNVTYFCPEFPAPEWRAQWVERV